VAVEGTVVVAARDRRCNLGVDGVDVQCVVENAVKAMLGKRRSSMVLVGRMRV
jgi:hypothetical protein